MANMANQGKEADARVLDAQTRAKQVEADIALTQAKTQEIMANIGGGVPGSEGGESFQDQVKMAELKLQHQDIMQRSQDAALDAVNRKRDRDSRERLAAMRFAETAMQNPASLGVAQQLIDPQMLQRLESTEEPLTPAQSPDGKLE
jgi:ABC-type proline/glycine betaine transport system substrate-binding protein